jgi:hypothetical protein
VSASPTSVERVPGPNPWRRGTVSCQRGAVFVEFLIAFLPVYVFFLCLLQLAVLFSVRLVTEHAAISAARAAAVVLAEKNPRRYAGERPHSFSTSSGPRHDAIRNAALLSLSPFILNGFIDTVTLSFPAGDKPLGSAQRGAVKVSPMSDHKVPKVRIRLEVEALCRIGIANLIACALPLYVVDRKHGYVNPLQPTVAMMTEAVFPYQGASYD